MTVTRTSLVLISAFVLAGTIALPRDATAQRTKKIDSRITEVEEELSLLRDVAGDAAHTASDAKKQLEALELELKELRGETKKDVDAVSKSVEASGAAMGKQGERLDAVEGGIKGIHEELEKRRIDFTAQIRVRPQYITNTRNFRSDLDEDQDLFFNQRVRLGIGVKPVDFMGAFIQLQDVRTFGTNSMVEDGSNAARIHQAYIKSSIPGGLELKVGRQEWAFGSERVIGNDDWTQMGRAFDGLDLTWTFKDYIVADALFALLNERAAADGDDKLFGGLYLTSPILEPMAIDLYYLYHHDPRVGARRNFSTLGGRLSGRLPWHKALLFDLEATVQFGTVSEGDPGDQLSVENSHFAAAYHVMFGYEIPVVTSPTIKAFFLSASGDPNRSPVDPANNKHTAYLPLFPSSHVMLGRMDVFSQSNIWSAGTEVSLTPYKGVRVELQYHYLALVDEYGDIPAGHGMVTQNREYPSAKDIGSEIDLSAVWDVNANFALGGGYSVLLPGAAIEDQVRPEREVLEGDQLRTYVYPGGDPAHWVWLQADFRF
ncbi:MAG: alginate export family protein [Pseudomonadota bacterium]